MEKLHFLTGSKGQLDFLLGGWLLLEEDFKEAYRKTMKLHMSQTWNPE